MARNVRAVSYTHLDVYKRQYLINDCGVYPNKVLAISFTNKAAREMKERVENLLGDVAKAVTISTIHSFCVRLLREDILELGYPRNFTILDADDQKSVLRDRCV